MNNAYGLLHNALISSTTESCQDVYKVDVWSTAKSKVVLAQLGILPSIREYDNLGESLNI